jgi:hypothetical protein
MTWRRKWGICGAIVAVAALIVILIVGPWGPAGCYEAGVWPLSGTKTYFVLSGGKVTVLVGTNRADVGRYERAPNGWTMMLHEAENPENKLEPPPYLRNRIAPYVPPPEFTNIVKVTWWGLTVSNPAFGRPETWKRCPPWW